MVVSKLFYFHPYLGTFSNLTHSFQMGWFNHQLGNLSFIFSGSLQNFNFNRNFETPWNTVKSINTWVAFVKRRETTRWRNIPPFTGPVVPVVWPEYLQGPRVPKNENSPNFPWVGSRVSNFPIGISRGFLGGFNFFFVHPYLGKLSNFTHIFSDGLVQPPTSFFCWGGGIWNL